VRPLQQQPLRRGRDAHGRLIVARTSAGAPSLALWLGLALLVIVLDQWSKTWILGQFQLGDTRHVTSFFNLVRVHNTGAAFSFLAGAAGWQRWFFIGLGLVAAAFIVWMLRRHPAHKLFCFAITMILGGAIGNVVDRALHGYVVDFLQFRFALLEPVFRGGYFPSFNLADSAITLGAVLLIVDELRRVRRGG
jgi:signal peptidase II